MEEILKVFMTMGVFIPVVIIALMWLGNVINDAISRQTTIWPTVLSCFGYLGRYHFGLAIQCGGHQCLKLIGIDG